MMFVQSVITASALRVCVKPRDVTQNLLITVPVN